MQEEKTHAEESLEAFKKRIRKMSLDELYDELDAAEKEESDERMDIIINRMDKLEPIEQKKKKLKKEKENFKNAMVTLSFVSIFGGFYATEQIAFFLRNKQFGSSEALKAIKLSEVLSYIPYTSFVLIVLIVYSWSYLRQKHRTLDLGISGLCLSKAAMGLLFGCFPGFFITPGAVLSRFIACIVATFSFVFMYNVINKKQNGIFYDSAWPLLFITIAAEQIGWLEHL